MQHSGRQVFGAFCGPLLYTGDGHERASVRPVFPVEPRSDTLQEFAWPDGTRRLVPVYTVCRDTPEVRERLGLRVAPPAAAPGGGGTKT